MTMPSPSSSTGAEAPLRTELSRAAKIHDLSHHLQLTTNVLTYDMAKANHSLTNPKSMILATHTLR